MGGTDRFKPRRVPKRAALSRACLYGVRRGPSWILRGKSRAATPPSSSRRLSPFMRENSRGTRADPLKSGVEGFAERMERSCYFGKLSGRDERIGGGQGRRTYPFVGACRHYNQSTVRRCRNFVDGRGTPRKVHGFVLLPSSPEGSSSVAVSESGCQVYPPRFFRVVGWTRWDTGRKE